MRETSEGYLFQRRGPAREPFSSSAQSFVGPKGSTTIRVLRGMWANIQ